MNLEACFQMLIKVTKYAESEIRNKKISIMNIDFFVHILVNKFGKNSK